MRVLIAMFAVVLAATAFSRYRYWRRLRHLGEHMEKVQVDFLNGPVSEPDRTIQVEVAGIGELTQREGRRVVSPE